MNDYGNFKGIKKHFETNTAGWQEFFDGPTPQSADMPSPYNESSTKFQKLLILRVIRPDKLVPAVQSYVSGETHLFRHMYVLVLERN